ncbi:hypothetical protein D3C75_700700 [compost metagenome]
MFTEGLPVFGKATKAVAHCVGVLTEDQRTRFIRHADPLFNRPFRYRREGLILIDAGIHWTNNVGRGGVGAASFVLHRARRIGGLHPAVQGIVVSAVTRFIPQRPDDDRRMVTVTLHHTGYALAHRRQPARIVSQAAHWHHAVRFDIGLIHDVQPVAVAQPVPERVIRIMRAAHGVKIVLLHQLDVAAHGGFIHHLPVLRMVFMTVHPADQQRFAVEFQQAVTDFDLTETDVAGFNVKHLILPIAQHNG